MPYWRKISSSVLRVAFGVPIVSLFALGVLFLVFSVTWKGRCVGLCAVLLGGLAYTDEDHYLVMSQPDKVVRDVAEFMKAH